ncbi:HtaA domain-containing protein [Streptomyces caniscabiei]|uniref:HtaA domain-containing protein n=1 Tax=Streptomyces caniscabiei TaxID=2746961 RepID=A0A927LC69_9ACTN|nr:HtaA domain-containing protein [Streptomyces caniscabiei]MBD9729033.1 HtaA domain-containing protein [Streptomyces caniscabiei]MDX3514399.1 HtaA domain-containing protein [Streptomyces caniscabiei]MDX3719899.1 HtaA domain-containing protein [Streptomyces caniscabiei]WEO29025.1 HtaA domain-containing protein [Streptomyces caniscabiei]
MNRPGAAATAAGALLALLCQGAATAHDGGGAPREVSGGFASWDPSFRASTGTDATVTAGAPAVRGSGGRTWFPVDGGSATPSDGDADIALDGSIRLGGAGTDTLTLDRLRLRLDGGTGTLRVRAERAGESGDLTLAEVGTGAAAPNVRSGGATWSGLRVSLTAEGAALLTRWSGRPYAADDELAPLDMTVGTGTSGPTAPQDGPPGQSDGDASSSPPGWTDTPNGSADAGTDVDTGADAGAGAGREAGESPSVAVDRASLAAGEGQRVTGEGFAPGEVVLVAIDDDTRYQAVADASGRVARDFPVYDTATEGAHTVRLYSVTGGREAVAEFTVLVGGPAS